MRPKMSDLRRIVQSLQSLISRVISILSDPIPIRESAISVTYLIKRLNYQMDDITAPLSKLLVDVGQSQRELFKRCRELLDEVVTITSRHPQLFYAHTFLEIAYRMIVTICCNEGHVQAVNDMRLKLSSYSNPSIIIGEYGLIVKESDYDVKLIKINLEDALRIINEMLDEGIDKFILLYKSGLNGKAIKSYRSRKANT